MTEIKHELSHLGVAPWGTAVEDSNVRAAEVQRDWARRYRLKLAATDTAIVVSTVLCAFYIRFGFGDDRLPALRDDVYWRSTFIIAAAWTLALIVFRTRDPHIIGSGLVEYRRVTNASATTLGLLAIVFLLLKVDVSRGYFVFVLPLGTLGLLGSRWAWRRWLADQRLQGRYLSRAIVVGGADDVDYVIAQIREKPKTAFQVVGCAVNRSESSRAASMPGSVPVISDLGGIADAAVDLRADVVIVAGQPHAAPDFIRQLSWDLEGTAAELVLASRLTDVAGPRIHFRPVDGLPLIHVEIPQFDGGKHLLKRALDIGAASIALVLLSPLLLAIALAVRIDSPGPATFRQERVGRDGKTFAIVKFRSMCVDAEAKLEQLMDKNEGSGPLFKLKNDPRVTRIGNVLRRYSLDELPQLWNVFVGDMSLVGPRPPLQSEVATYEDAVRRRLFIKPGLTGMWQVNGRSNLSWQESVRLDLYYVENWSLTGDLVILWRTLRVVIKPDGAY